jgi:hypothetical protein
VLLDGQPRLQLRARGRACLDHHRALADPGGDGVAQREGVPGRAGRGPKLRHQRAAGRDRLGQVGVLGGIAAGDAGAEHGDRAAAGRQRGLVGGGIDPAGEPGDDGDPLVDQPSGHARRPGQPRPTRADHGDRTSVGGLQRAPAKQERWRVGDLPEVGRVVRVQDGDQPGADLLGERQLLGDEGLGLLQLIEAAVQHEPGRRGRGGALGGLAPPQRGETAGLLLLEDEQPPVDAAPVDSDRAQREQEHPVGVPRPRSIEHTFAPQPHAGTAQPGRQPAHSTTAGAGSKATSQADADAAGGAAPDNRAGRSGASSSITDRWAQILASRTRRAS